MRVLVCLGVSWWSLGQSKGRKIRHPTATKHKTKNTAKAICVSRELVEGLGFEGDAR